VADAQALRRSWRCGSRAALPFFRAGYISTAGRDLRGRATTALDAALRRGGARADLRGRADRRRRRLTSMMPTWRWCWATPCHGIPDGRVVDAEVVARFQELAVAVHAARRRGAAGRG
jgi:hypothetical protein